ncbi:hypothetical protein [Nostoc sp.]
MFNRVAIAKIGYWAWFGDSVSQPAQQANRYFSFSAKSPRINPGRMRYPLQSMHKIQVYCAKSGQVDLILVQYFCYLLANFNEIIRANSGRRRKAACRQISLIIVMNVVNPVLELIGQLRGK